MLSFASGSAIKRITAGVKAAADRPCQVSDLKPLAQALKVAHPAMLKAIAASKKKNDRADARKVADLLRCDLLPECSMAPSAI
jgi:hypothetical protein